MSFHQSYLTEFLKRPLPADPSSILGTASRYDVRLQQAPAVSGQSAWRVVGIHHLTGDENRGNHVVFVDIIDEQGNPLRDPALSLKWGWEGQRADERVEPKRFDKRLNEPATNVDVYSGQHIWVRVEGDGLPSDTVSNMHTKHADEPGPGNELWNSIGHHSFYVLFQRTDKTGTQENDQVHDGDGIKESIDEGTLNVISFGPFSHQDLINAFAAAAETLGLEDNWALLTKAGMDIFDLAQERRARYRGTPLHELPNLSIREKNVLMEELVQVLKTIPTPPLDLDDSEPDESIIDPEPSEPPPTPEAHGNKLGFYCHISTNQDDLWSAIQRVQPPVIMIHSDTANKMLLQEIRRFRAPDAFVIGRMYKDNHTQRLMLENDPERHGRAMAEEILAYDFGLATQQGDNGRRLIDAWMSLNEAVPGPGSDQYKEKPEETSRLLANYDRFQVAFHRRLKEAGVEAVAFNFGAGNFSLPEHYLEHFSQTLQAYTYLGFHEYGWPTMYPDPGSATSAGTYRQCMDGIREKYGDKHRVIITEAGLTRMYQNPQWGDKGWLNDDAPLTEDQYWQSLSWYNGYMLQDKYVLGACLYEVGHHGDWRTFRHLGKDHHGNDIGLIERIVGLKDAQPRSARAPEVDISTMLPHLRSISIKGRVTLNGFNVVGASARLIGGDETLGAMPGASLDAPSYVTWSRPISNVDGRLWDLWVQEVAQEVAGISWDEFKRQFSTFNPHYDQDENPLHPTETYWLPENPSAKDELRRIPVVWDRPVLGFNGNLWDGWIQYVQNKVVGLTYDQFKVDVLIHNPCLQADGRFDGRNQYNLPRNEDHKRYAVQDYTSGQGRFSFDGLPPGSYELIITAPDTEIYRTAFSTQGDLELDVRLLPLRTTISRYSPSATRSVRKHDFIQVAGQEFVERGQTFPFIGVNIRGLVHYGDRRTLQHSTEGHRLEQLRAAYEMGARVARVFLPSMHADAAATVDRLHQVIKLVSDNFPGFYLLPCFANLYADVPFRIPGDDGFYGRIDPHWNGDLLSGDFFHAGYEQNFLPFMRHVVQTFCHEPVIFGWEVGNELKLNPEGAARVDDPQLSAFIAFMHRAGREIRNLDTNHLITTGLISTHHCWMHTDELKRRLYSSDHFDFMTVHCYNHEYQNDDSGLADSLNMPYIVEEAGFDTGFAGGDRAQLIRQDMDRWFGRGAKGYMQWGFMATHNDMGDGDGRSGMDRSLHNDWDALYAAYQERAAHLTGQRLTINVPPKKIRPSKPVKLSPGATVFAQTVVNVRQSPGHLNKPEGDVLGQLGQGASAVITGESVVEDELVWWPIEATLTNGETVEAWVAQAVQGQVLISAAQPLAASARSVMVPLG